MSFDWKMIKPLGEGGFGQVLLWKNTLTGQEIATKLLKRNADLREDELSALHRRWLLESTWMRTLKTPYIVSAINVNDEKFIAYLQQQHHWPHLPIITMEYCNGGDLRRHLLDVANLNGLNQRDVLDVIRTLRNAVEYLHEQCNIEHRDIKPENIVLHINKNGNKIYKLADFGYARDIPDSTINQSVVGTRHYVAPEVIDPGSYSRTVDYWSVGIIVYEIICGVRPFIEHSSMFNIIGNVRRKPRKCITISEMLDDPERFQFHEHISQENNLNPVLVEQMENWLRIALDNDYSKRGLNADGQLTFYTDLDKILQMKIVSVFSLSSFEIYYYDIAKFQNINEFWRQLFKDTKIDIARMFIAFPPLHPKSNLSQLKTPQDLYVEEWAANDDSGLNNPPVMLYVTDIEQCDCNVPMECLPISDTIQHCMNLDAAHCQLADWIVKQFERHVHYLLSRAQRFVECYTKGLYQYVISVEHELFPFEKNIEIITKQSAMLSGAVRQFSSMIDSCKDSMCDQFNEKWSNKNKQYLRNDETLNVNIVSTVNTRYRSAKKHCKDNAAKTIYQSLAESDIFNLESFRNYLRDARNCSSVERIETCQNAVEYCIKEMKKFQTNPILKDIRSDTNKQWVLFTKIKESVGNAWEQNRVQQQQSAITSICSYINNTNLNLKEDTKQFLLEMAQVLIAQTTPAVNEEILEKMDTLRIDGTRNGIIHHPAAAAATISNIPTNGQTENDVAVGDGDTAASMSIINGFHQPFDTHTVELIEESKKLITLMESSMEIEGDDISMPTTLNDL